MICQHWRLWSGSCDLVRESGGCLSFPGRPYRRTGWLKTTEIHCLPVLETRSAESNASRAVLARKALGEPASSLCRSLLCLCCRTAFSPGCICPHTANFLQEHGHTGLGHPLPALDHDLIFANHIRSDCFQRRPPSQGLRIRTSK